MSFPQDVLAALNFSSEPLTNAGLRKALDIEGQQNANQRVANALTDLVKVGAVQRLNDQPGWSRYAPVAGYKPKRTNGARPAPCQTRTATDPVASQPKASAAQTAALRAVEAAFIDSVAPDATEQPTTADVQVPRETLRLLLAGVLVFAGDRMGPSLRHAVIDATKIAA